MPACVYTFNQMFKCLKRTNTSAKYGPILF